MRANGACASSAGVRYADDVNGGARTRAWTPIWTITIGAEHGRGPSERHKESVSVAVEVGQK